MGILPRINVYERNNRGNGLTISGLFFAITQILDKKTFMDGD